MALIIQKKKLCDFLSLNSWSLQFKLKKNNFLTLGKFRTFPALLDPSNYYKKLKFAKSHIYRVLGASKVKGVFSTYFSTESTNQKNISCIINLVYSPKIQVNNRSKPNIRF
jgi:hypothetical protein